MNNTLESISNIGFSELDENKLFLVEGGSYSKIDGGGTRYATGYMGKTDPIKAEVDFDFKAPATGFSCGYDDESQSITASVGLMIGEINVSIGFN